MLEAACVKTVNSLSIALVKVAGLSAVSTAEPKYLTSQVISSGGFWTGFKQLGDLFAQPQTGLSDLFGQSFYTFSPKPINNTNLKKDS